MNIFKIFPFCIDGMRVEYRDDPDYERDNMPKIYPPSPAPEKPEMTPEECNRWCCGCMVFFVIFVVIILYFIFF